MASVDEATGYEAATNAGPAHVERARRAAPDGELAARWLRPCRRLALAPGGSERRDVDVDHVAILGEN